MALAATQCADAEEEILKIIYYITAHLRLSVSAVAQPPSSGWQSCRRWTPCPASIIVNAMLKGFAEILRAGAQYQATTDEHNLQNYPLSQTSASEQTCASNQVNKYKNTSNMYKSARAQP